ncbi:MAG: hypothetical protein SVQ76_02255 [Candidatus Nanohaloarchaea archaeon]|nr:hypothetical protein [Candidatus Nanohaloarchaea archaeon]
MDMKLTLGLVLVATIALAGCTSGGQYGGTQAPTEDQTGDQQNNQQETQDQQQQTGPAVEVVSGVSPDRTIYLTNYEFSSSNPSVSPGTVIRFVNQEGSHTVTLDAAGIDQTLSGSQSVMLRFNEGGTYQVYCRFHGSPGSGMHSDVTVG